MAKMKCINCQSEEHLLYHPGSDNWQPFLWCSFESCGVDQEYPDEFLDIEQVNGVWKLEGESIELIPVAGTHFACSVCGKVNATNPNANGIYTNVPLCPGCALDKGYCLGCHRHRPDEITATDSGVCWECHNSAYEETPDGNP